MKAIVPWHRIITLLNLQGIFGHLPGRGWCLQEVRSKKQEQSFSEIGPFSLCCALASGSEGRQSSPMALMLTLRPSLCVLLRRADLSQPHWLSPLKVAGSRRTCPVSRWGVVVGCQGCFSKCTRLLHLAAFPLVSGGLPSLEGPAYTPFISRAKRSVGWRLGCSGTSWGVGKVSTVLDPRVPALRMMVYCVCVQSCPILLLPHGL